MLSMSNAPLRKEHFVSTEIASCGVVLMQCGRGWLGGESRHE